jgi:hypothetical protein
MLQGGSNSFVRTVQLSSGNTRNLTPQNLHSHHRPPRNFPYLITYGTIATEPNFVIIALLQDARHAGEMQRLPSSWFVSLLTAPKKRLYLFLRSIYHATRSRLRKCYFGSNYIQGSKLPKPPFLPQMKPIGEIYHQTTDTQSESPNRRATSFPF